MEVLDESRRRLNYAKRLLEKKRVMEALIKYGRVLPVGSLALEVYWNRDIDIVVETKDLRGSSLGALGEFIEERKFSKYQYGDFVEYPREGRPEGYIVNLFHRDIDGEVWEVEIWFLEDISYYEKQLEEWKSSLNEKNRKKIIEIKAGGSRQGSKEIYEKVLEKGE